MPQPSTESGIIIVLLVTNLFQLILQIAQMFFNNKQSNKDLLIKDLQDRSALQDKAIADLRLELQNEREQRHKLEDLVFDLTKEKAYLDGQLQATQKRKEDLANGV